MHFRLILILLFKGITKDAPTLKGFIFLWTIIKGRVIF